MICTSGAEDAWKDTEQTTRAIVLQVHQKEAAMHAAAPGTDGKVHNNGRANTSNAV